MEKQTVSPPKVETTTPLANKMRAACAKIAPLWSLENFVAVNPWLGFSDQQFDTVAQKLAQLGGIRMTLPASFYLSKIKEGEITKADLKKAIATKSDRKIEVEHFLSQLQTGNIFQNQLSPLPTVTETISKSTKKDWNRFVVSRISHWASGYFDKGQAAWNASMKDAGIFEAWKREAAIDRTPEIGGIKGFRRAVRSFPRNPLEAAEVALSQLKIHEEALPLYLHRLLLRVGGWAAFAARMDWDSKLKGEEGGALIQFLAILICWEASLLQCFESPEIWKGWNVAKRKFQKAAQTEPFNREISKMLILQEAFELAEERKLVAKFRQSPAPAPSPSKKTKAQAIFCIDVRSEVFRRKLEQTDPQIATLGFAGFFGFPINYLPVAHQKGEAQCPVLIPAGPTVPEEVPGKSEAALENRKLRQSVRKAWKSFKSGAVTCFSFVSPMGISFLPKLLTDSFGLTRPVPHPEKMGLDAKDFAQKRLNLEPRLLNGQQVGIPLPQRVEMAKNALTAMSLKEDFADFVLIVGHGSSSVNNPHASGLDCGACGGRSGESNAKVAATILNDPQVRTELATENIIIPQSTHFLACLHDTTTDEISIFHQEEVPEEKKQEFAQLKESLAKAGQETRFERSLRMNTQGDAEKDVLKRSKDWSQIRPEWGLAGCNSFVVANRNRTRNIDLGGKAFLHSYDWKKDEDFGVLEGIMTAPLVVTSWINLQYFASTVDNKNLGAGNKTLHNVTAGVGVLEGFSGDLRVGLPMQSVHDGEKYQHEPARLKVIIEAPREAMNSILEKHDSVRTLCDNAWIHLFAMDKNGQVSHKYEGDFRWKAI